MVIFFQFFVDYPVVFMIVWFSLIEDSASYLTRSGILPYIRSSSVWSKANSGICLRVVRRPMIQVMTH